MHMTHAGWVCNDCIGDKGRLSSLVSFDTRLPAAFQHLSEHVSFAAYVTGFDTGEAGDQTGVFDDVCHELGGVASQGIKLESSGAHEVFEDTVSCDADSVTVVTLQSAAKGDEGLHIATAASDLDHDVESRWWRSCPVGLWKIGWG